MRKEARSSSMACVTSTDVTNVTKSWLLDRYAKFSCSKSLQTVPGNNADNCKASNNGVWKQFSSGKSQGSFQITLIEDKHLMLSCGTQIHESFSLINASEWLRTVCKGDSLLFLLKINNEGRKFRVKFAATGTTNACDNCQDFTNKVASLFPVKIIPIVADNGATSSQQFVEDCQSTTGVVSVQQGVQEVPDLGVSLPEITKQLLSNTQTQNVPTTTLPTSDLSTLIMLCLTDPAFPDFVAKVEEELNILSSSSCQK